MPLSPGVIETNMDVKLIRTLNKVVRLTSEWDQGLFLMGVRQVLNSYVTYGKYSIQRF